MKIQSAKILIIFLFSYFNIFSQPDITVSDNRLAYEYYNNKEFDKAEVLFDRLYNKTRAKVYFNYYVTCLVEQKKYDEAEKKIKKQIRKQKNDLSYYVDLGFLYNKKEEPEKAKKQFEKALNKLSDRNPQIVGLANAFTQRREYEYAVRTYTVANKFNGKHYYRELAYIYSAQRKYPEMISQYLNMLSEDRKQKKRVQDRLQYYVSKDINDEFTNILRTELLKRIQKNSNIVVYNEMLVWLFMQRKEFDKALIQARAVDKRVRGSGRKVIDLAKTALANSDFETALSAYLYVIEKGTKKPYFTNAKIGRLNVLYQKVISEGLESDEEISKLEQEYLSTIKTLGISTVTVNSIVDLAHIQAFYLNKSDEAVSLLEEAVAIKGLSKDLVAKCKIELADVLVYRNDLDLSALIYGQAEKENKQNEIGDIAKLRKAKLAYYRTDFRWAKAQFDALKTSTSKPVANDALFFSLLIDTNTKDDSIPTAMKIYARSDLLIFRHKYAEALLMLDTLISEFPAHELIDEAYVRKAEIYSNLNDYDNAILFLKKLITERSYAELADVAVYRLAVIYDEKLDMKDEAAEFYKKLMLEYPDSIRVADARKRFRRIREGS